MRHVKRFLVIFFWLICPSLQWCSLSGTHVFACFVSLLASSCCASIISGSPPCSGARATVRLFVLALNSPWLFGALDTSSASWTCVHIAHCWTKDAVSTRNRFPQTQWWLIFLDATVEVTAPPQKGHVYTYASGSRSASWWRLWRVWLDNPYHINSP